MRVLVLSQYFWPESFRINEVVESLRYAGLPHYRLDGAAQLSDG